MRNRNQKGFTLIELLIVIAIIGILAAVLIPNLLAARTRANDTTAQSCARSIATGQEIYAIDNVGNYATALNQLESGVVSGCTNPALTVTPGASWIGTTPWTVRHSGGRTTYSVDARGITGAP